MKKGDFAIIAITIFISICGIFVLNKDKGYLQAKTIEIVQDRKLINKYVVTNKEFEKKITVNTKYGQNIVYIHDFGVEIIDANCNDKVCVKSGFISRKGQIVACLPHKLYVKIMGEEELDNISY